MTDLAIEAEAGSEDTEDNGSSTTLEATPMVSPPQSKACYKRVATKTTPKIEKEEMLQYLRKDGEQHATAALVHWMTTEGKGQDCTYPSLHVDS
ncbi:hypothetical protein V6N12_050557 [Hibiscus sabdariffa]|uniref:Uncharacterized protein n=1 Tax=Hibiscus sabdariffa TaxID=183260 RepID=A0ABR2GDX7_9ROSI